MSDKVFDCGRVQDMVKALEKAYRELGPYRWNSLGPASTKDWYGAGWRSGMTLKALKANAKGDMAVYGLRAKDMMAAVCAVVGVESAEELPALVRLYIKVPYEPTTISCTDPDSSEKLEMTVRGRHWWSRVELRVVLRKLVLVGAVSGGVFGRATPKYDNYQCIVTALLNGKPEDWKEGRIANTYELGYEDLWRLHKVAPCVELHPDFAAQATATPELIRANRALRIEYPGASLLTVKDFHRRHEYNLFEKPRREDDDAGRPAKRARAD